MEQDWLLRNEEAMNTDLDCIAPAHRCEGYSREEIESMVDERRSNRAA